MVMASYYSSDKLSELWLQITKLHLSYLQTEDSPQKIDQRIKLENYVQEFLCLAPHNQKFTFYETAEIFLRSATQKSDFSGYKAAVAWNAISMYAGNLLSQPWRKEYKQIKLYCGFFKHHVDANIVGGETMLEAMGYKHEGDQIMYLNEPVCPDRVSNVSLDSIVAFVECQILKKIWEEVSIVYKISWLDVLEFRSGHICSPDQAIRSLVCPRSQLARPVEHFVPPAPAPPLPPRYSHFSPPGAAACSFAAATSPYYGCAAYTPLMPAGGHCYAAPPAAFQLAYQPAGKPHFFAGPYHCGPQYACSVPTGQLIELDAVSADGVDAVDGHQYRTAGRPGLPPSRSSGDNLENWDFVYKNLEIQGYSKDLGERGDVLLSATDSKKSHQSAKERKSKLSIELDRDIRNLNLNSAKSPDIQRPKSDCLDTVASTERKSAQNHLPEKRSPTLMTNGADSSPEKARSAATACLDIKKLRKNQDFGGEKRARPPGPADPDKWECKTCTYLNSPSRQICEMCSRSRAAMDQTMAVGGSECSTCTLVNPKEEQSCRACGASLLNSPTYI